MLQASWEDRDNTLWIELEGDLDHQDCLDLRDEFQERIAKSKGDVVIVLAGVGFLSSFGIGMMLGASKLLAERGNQLKLSGTPERIQELLKTMSLLDAFTLI